MRSSAQPLPSRPSRPSREQPRRRPAPAPSRPVQLPLFGEATPSLPETSRPRLVPNPDAYRLELLRRLNRLSSGRLRSLTLTDNRRTILSVRPAPAADRTRLELRIHHSFLEAPEDVLRAVADFVDSKKGSERARQALNLIREHFSRHKGAAGRVRRPVLRSAGCVLDLREIVDDLNRRYFEGRLSAEVTWGRATGAAGRVCRRGRTASLQLGSYSYEDNLIRVHRVLDNPDVPRYVVEAVVHHELLHADMPPEVRNGRRFFHTPEFRQRERQFRNLGRANAWIQEHLPELLRARREAQRRLKRR
ncbi:MAG TPA: hypothetical protein VN493_20665 [Thermoanaerobaculia bacterium]|nr:hypothetical protein [Thermoanaerobaculia bacterium]